MRLEEQGALSDCDAFRIRRIRESDKEAVIALLNESFPHVGMTRRRLEERIARGARFFVAESCGEVVGFADMWVGRSACLRGISVKQEWRRKGVGGALLNRAIVEAKRLGKKSVWLKVQVSNAEAVRFYKERGFFVKREEEGRFGRMYVMARELET